MARYRVTGVCFDQDGVLLHPPNPKFDEHGRSIEIIDTATNAIFAECHSTWDVEDRYEAFWNRLNPDWEQEFPTGKERVKVVRVEPLDEKDPLDEDELIRPKWDPDVQLIH